MSLKRLALLFVFIITIAPSYSIEEDVILFSPDIEEEAIVKENDKFKLTVEKNLWERKKLIFENSFINELSGEIRYQGNFNYDIDNENKSATYPFNINTVVESKFGENKYRFFGEYAFTRDIEGLDNDFTSKFSNLYLERAINKNNTLRFGTFLAPIGLEGAYSTFNLPLAQKGQISRNFSSAYVTGLSVFGQKDFFEYNLGGYTSTRYTQGFKDGLEFVGRVGIKPFYKNNSYFKDLKMYLGSDIGHRSENYEVYFGALTYDYKKFHLDVEAALAHGSNSVFYNPNKREGFFTTLSYKLTKKLEFLVRYDYFNSNTRKSNTDRVEYTVGLNYYLHEQRLRFGLNYVYTDNIEGAKNKNGIVLMSQFII